MTEIPIDSKEQSRPLQFNALLRLKQPQGQSSSIPKEETVNNKELSPSIKMSTGGIDSSSIGAQATSWSNMKWMTGCKDGEQGQCHSQNPSCTTQQNTRFFALRRGRDTKCCIYIEEQDFLQQINGFDQAEYRKFHSWDDAYNYIVEASNQTKTSCGARAQSMVASNNCMRSMLANMTQSQYQILTADEKKTNCSTDINFSVRTLDTMNDATPSIEAIEKTDEPIGRDEWEQHFDELAEYYSLYGTSDVPTHTLLGHFAARQKIEYAAYLQSKPSILTQERVEKLKCIEFCFGGHKDRKTFGTYAEELTKYREKNGGRDPPSGSILFKWICSCKKKYMEYKRCGGEKSVLGMDDSRCEVLERVGFKWTLPFQNQLQMDSVTACGSNPDTANESYITSMTAHGIGIKDAFAADVPSDSVVAGDETTKPAMNVNNAIEVVGANCSSNVTLDNAQPQTDALPAPHRVAQSKSLQFYKTTAVARNIQEIPVQTRRNKKRKVAKLGDEGWDEMFREIKQFKEQNGHCIPSIQHNTKLRQWVDKICQEYKKSKEIDSSILTEQRVQCLRDIGFQFEQKVKPRTWEERFQELVRFKQQHGHCKVPRLYEGLGKWVADQRMKYNYMLKGKKSNLTPEKARRLTELGMIWAVFKLPPKEERATRKPWAHRFEELVDFKKQHGHCRVPQAFPVLGQWVHTQRVNYKLMKQGRKSAMTPDQAIKLQGIGFAFEVMPRKQQNMRHSLGNPFPRKSLIEPKEKGIA